MIKVNISETEDQIMDKIRGWIFGQTGKNLEPINIQVGRSYGDLVNNCFTIKFEY